MMVVASLTGAAPAGARRGEEPAPAGHASASSSVDLEDAVPAMSNGVVTDDRAEVEAAP